MATHTIKMPLASRKLYCHGGVLECLLFWLVHMYTRGEFLCMDLRTDIKKTCVQKILDYFLKIMMTIGLRMVDFSYMSIYGFDTFQFKKSL